MYFACFVTSLGGNTVAIACSCPLLCAIFNRGLSVVSVFLLVFQSKFLRYKVLSCKLFVTLKVKTEKEIFAFTYLKPKLKKQQEWLAVWMILSGETNICERKQNQTHRRPPYARLWHMCWKQGRNEKLDTCWKQIRWKY